MIGALVFPALWLCTAVPAPTLTLDVAYVELPGAKPEATIIFRGVTEAKLSLFRADVASTPAKTYFGDEGGVERAAKRKLVTSWTVALNETEKDKPTRQAIALAAQPPGVYVLSAEAGALRDETLLYVTPYAAVAKLGASATRFDARDVLVWLTDAVSSRAIGGASAIAFVEIQDGETSRTKRIDAACDSKGLCRMSMPPKMSKAAIWVGKGDVWTYVEAAPDYWDSPEREMLAYVITDRPLYKPNEKVGIKVFARGRGGGGPGRPIANKKLRVITADDRGQEIDRHEVRTNAFGTASFLLPLAKDAALGLYQVSVENPNDQDTMYLTQAGGVFRIEEYKLPEMLVTVEPVGSTLRGQAIKVRVTASLYAGGPVPFADGRATVTFHPWTHFFARWDDEPDDWLTGLFSGYGGGASYPRGYGGDSIGLGGLGKNPRARAKTPCFNWQKKDFAFRTGEDGVAEIEIEGACPSVPEHTASVSVSLTDLSRREVSGRGEVNVSHTAWYADVRTDHFLYKPGERIHVTVRAEDSNSRPESPIVQVRLVRADSSNKEVLRKDLVLSAGRGEIDLETKELGGLRIEVRPQGADPADEDTLATSDLWLTSDTEAVVPPWRGMFVTTDRRPARAGSTLRGLVISEVPGGDALITLEGDGVYAAHVLPMRGRARYFEVPLTGVMTPAVTLAVSRFERCAHNTAGGDISVFGSEMPIDVKVKPTVTSALPGSTMPVTVGLAGTPAGTDVEVALAMVDDALTTITAPDSEGQPDLVTFFARTYMGNRVLTTSTSDSWHFRELPALPAPASEETPPDYFDAMFSTIRSTRPSKYGSAYGSGGESKEGVGGLGLRGAGVGGGGVGDAVGLASSRGGATAPTPVHVRSKFGSSAGWYPDLHGSLGGSASASARFSDSLTRWRLVAYAVSASGHVGMGAVNVRTELPLMVRLQAPRFLTERDEVVVSAVVSSRLPQRANVDVAIDAPGLKPLGPAQRTVALLPKHDARLDVRYAVTSAGERRVRAIARAGGASDAMEWKLPSGLHSVPVRSTFAGALQEKVTFAVSLPEQRNKNATALVLTISPSLLSAMLDALPFLAEYPYGCVEQTLSRFVPAVAAARVVKKLGVPATRVPKNLDAMVDAGLQRLYSFHHSDGGWGWWQTDPSDLRMTAYVLVGLALAIDAGVKVDPTKLERGRAWLLAQVDKAEGEELAFAAYALAASGGATKALLDKVALAAKDMNDRGRAFVALALATAKDQRGASVLSAMSTLFAAAEDRLSDPRLVDAWKQAQAIEILALALTAAVRLNDARVPVLTNALLARRHGDRWHSTRDTALAVYALAEQALQAREKLTDGTIRVLVNGKVAATRAYKSGGAEYQALRFADTSFVPGANQIVVEHKGEANGHYAAVFEVGDNAEDVKARSSEHVAIARRYFIGDSATPASAPALLGLASGQRVIVELAVTVAKPVEYLMIEDLKPAGLEAVATRSGPEICGYHCTHAELRPDRVALFFRHLHKGTHTFSYELRAEAPGAFHGLPARVEAMYAPEIFATSDEARVTVEEKVPGTFSNAAPAIR
ncbi:MAG: hypothetical protein IT381_33500 [Deltaproteobacteria bacterium]|nr:hypothetical protein [Deltaproteobacteria bacterium]